MSRLRAALLVALAMLLGACRLHTREPPLVAREPAPTFSLPADAGANVGLASLIERGPAVVVFYRGFW